MIADRDGGYREQEVDGEREDEPTPEGDGRG